MKRIYIIFVALSFSIALKAQNFIYDVGFFENFDNREYLDLSPSKTIFGAVLSPVVGIQIDEHQLFASPYVMTDLGSKNINLYFAFWYRLRKEHFRISAGIFPANDSHEQWSSAFVNEEQQWYRPYLNGLLFGYDSDDYNFELGVDWRGLYADTPTTREEFVVFSSGHKSINKRWTFGYNAFMHHFACSPIIKNVSDDILVEPYARLDLNQNGYFQNFYLKLGLLGSLQRDRSESMHFDRGSKIEFSALLQKWDFKIDNRFYYGNVFHSVNQEGIYFNDTFFGASYLYDRFEFGYCPSLGKYINLNCSIVLHFIDNQGYIGNQAKIGLTFNLNSL